MSETALVIAAHADDEVLGCGGTIAKLTKTGTRVEIAFLADAVSSRTGHIDSAELQRRQDAARQACRILGASGLSFGQFPDNSMDRAALLDVTRHVESLIAAHRPRTILTHFAGDLNVDHRCVHDAVVTACRPQAGHPVKTLLFFEVMSSTEWQAPDFGRPFTPTWFIDISGTLDLKLQALAAYSEELRHWPHPRSMEGVQALARWRGATIGTQAAEAFVLGRHLT